MPHLFSKALLAMKIAISGLSGCGNTTACKNVAKLLALKIVNYTFRDLAKEMNLTLDQLQAKAKGNPYYDYLVDKRQLELVENENSYVMGSRLAGWLIEDADLRVWLTASPEVRAKRIAKREESALQAALEHTAKRDAENQERYARYYGVDVRDLGGYDLILNTELLAPEQVAAVIVEAAKKAKASGAKKPSKLARSIREKVFSEVARLQPPQAIENGKKTLPMGKRPAAKV